MRQSESIELLCKQQKTDLQEVIKYIQFKGLTSTEIKAELDVTLLEFASSLPMVKKQLPS